MQKCYIAIHEGTVYGKGDTPLEALEDADKNGMRCYIVQLAEDRLVKPISEAVEWDPKGWTAV